MFPSTHYSNRYGASHLDLQPSEDWGRWILSVRADWGNSGFWTNGQMQGAQ